MRIKFCNIKTGKIKSEKGFTLLELVFVTVVTGILSSTLILPFTSSIKQATRPEIYNTATYLAVEEIEKKRSDGYSATIGTIGVPSTSTVTIGVRTYTVAVFTEYVSHSAGSFSNSASSTEYIRVSVTVSNADMPNNIFMWTILTDDFYDLTVNPP